MRGGRIAGLGAVLCLMLWVAVVQAASDDERAMIRAATMRSCPDWRMPRGVPAECSAPSGGASERIAVDARRRAQLFEKQRARRHLGRLRQPHQL